MMKIRIFILLLVIPVFMGYSQSQQEEAVDKNVEIIRGSISLKGWYNLGIGGNGTLNISLTCKDSLINGLRIQAQLANLKIDTLFSLSHKKNDTIQPLLLGGHIDKLMKISLTENFCGKGGKLEVMVVVDKKKHVENFFILPDEKYMFKCFHQNIKTQQLNLIDKIILNLKGSIYNRSKIRPKEYFIIPFKT